MTPGSGRTRCWTGSRASCGSGTSEAGAAQGCGVPDVAQVETGLAADRGLDPPFFDVMATRATPTIKGIPWFRFSAFAADGLAADADRTREMQPEITMLTGPRSVGDNRPHFPASDMAGTHLSDFVGIRRAEAMQITWACRTGCGR